MGKGPNALTFPIPKALPHHKKMFCFSNAISQTSSSTATVAALLCFVLFYGFIFRETAKESASSARPMRKKVFRMTAIKYNFQDKSVMMLNCLRRRRRTLNEWAQVNEAAHQEFAELRMVCLFLASCLISKTFLFFCFVC